jgi:hypothetical protein
MSPEEHGEAYEKNIEIFINEENDIFYSDEEGEVNVSAAILDWLESSESQEQGPDELVLVREAALKLLRAVDERLK